MNRTGIEGGALSVFNDKKKTTTKTTNKQTNKTTHTQPTNQPHIQTKTVPEEVDVHFKTTLMGT